MWKWILLGVGVLICIGIFAVVTITNVNPQGFADFVLAMADEFDVEVDGRRFEVKVSEFEGGTTVEDRTYLVQKMLALLALRLEDPEFRPAWEEYNRAFAEMAEDRTLTAEENEFLRELHSDLVSDEEIRHWMLKFRELERSGKLDEEEVDFF